MGLMRWREVCLSRFNWVLVFKVPNKDALLFWKKVTSDHLDFHDFYRDQFLFRHKATSFAGKPEVFLLTQQPGVGQYISTFLQQTQKTQCKQTELTMPLKGTVHPGNKNVFFCLPVIIVSILPHQQPGCWKRDKHLFSHHRSLTVSFYYVFCSFLSCFTFGGRLSLSTPIVQRSMAALKKIVISVLTLIWCNNSIVVMLQHKLQV